MLISPIPDSWQDLQKETARILEECGLSVEIEKDIQTVRGTVNIDVYAMDLSQLPPATYLCECKHWHNRVPQTVVHAFSSVVANYGANWGFIISSSGYQKGAVEASANSNIRLLKWEEFQQLFLNRWIDTYMAKRLREEEIFALDDYVEPSTSIHLKAQALSPTKRARFLELRQQYLPLASLISFYRSRGIVEQKFGIDIAAVPLDTPVRELRQELYLRPFLEALCADATDGIRLFDEVFEARA